MSLEGKVALVTGAGRGIGRAICRRLAADGAGIVAVARSGEELESLCGELRGTGGDCWAIAADLRDRQGGFLSGGEQQMLTIARTLMGNPDLLLLDEPSEGLAPLVVDALLAKIGDLKAQGLTILLAEQGVDFSLALADRVYVLEKGAVRFSGAAAALKSDRALLDRLMAM